VAKSVAANLAVSKLVQCHHEEYSDHLVYRRCWVVMRVMARISLVAIINQQIFIVSVEQDWRGLSWSLLNKLTHRNSYFVIRPIINIGLTVI